ncbi:GDSL-type esterase/lipase family protein [Paractinoplanes atraurantiacus]|uniref:Fibronectin type III domain-containing protein n=1 Tax=Paractinoplanes atraurantiacus TaxID=1036182 RepID=A0A285KCY5_9ACTN|nr:GDSL-type esterase/lipase family protein [Actinoplanes atraurantiacus]SNY70113.1 Fibronectin type III domain-containing protein [Actinoplanes atraurantiacus]
MRWLHATTAVLLALSGAVVAGPAAAAPTAAVRQTDESSRMEIGLALTPGRRQVEVTLRSLVDRPAGRIRLTVHRGDDELTHITHPLKKMEAERAVRVVFAIPATGDGDFGLVAQPLPGADTGFLAVRPHHGTLVSAGAYGLLGDAALTADRSAGRVTATEFETRRARLHQAAGSTGTSGTKLAATTTIAGSISYRDLANTQRPIRGARVQLVAATGQEYGTGYASDGGAFSFSSATLPTGDYRIRVVAVGTFGEVDTTGGADNYVAYSAVFPVTAGATVSGITVNVDYFSVTGRAFALFDALRTVGGFYQSVRKSSWQPALIVFYPSGQAGSFARGGNIWMSGGDTMCGTNTYCGEDAFDWDVLAHESGHIVATQAGLNGPNDGGDHGICDNAWGQEGRGKAAGLDLAWSEGWATFYGLALLASVPLPPVPNAGGLTYEDRPGPPHNAGGTVAYNIETNDPTGDCAPKGEDSELAVQRALWDLYDTIEDDVSGGKDTVQWGLADILNRLDSANATTFGAAWPAITASRGPSEVQAARRILQTHGMAPRGLLPADSIGNALVPFRWTAGGIPGHLNNSFTLRVRSGYTGSVLFTVTTTATSYTPTAAQWGQVVAAKSVVYDVAGSQTTAPVSGPYPSAEESFMIGSGSRKIMVVGDSISQGLEGDYTWRYRLWQHLATGGAAADFVGPYTGTTRVPSDLPDGFPEVAAPPVFNGAYRGYLTFDSAHFAQWGRQAHQAMGDIRTQVGAYQPDYLLVELGFNDLGWGVSNPDGLIGDMKNLITQARAARPGIKVVVANVVHREPLDQLPQLDSIINEYNSKLPAALASVSTAASPVALADIAGDYQWQFDAYDGLHPNGSGEHKIAKAFATVLSGTFGVGGTFTATSGPDLLSPAAPTSITATPTGTGVHVSWAHSFGAGGYWFEQRLKDSGQQWQRLPLPIPGDEWDTGWLVRGSTYEFRVLPNRGISTGPASPAASVTANPLTADGPPNITTSSGPGSLTVSWSRATGLYSDTVNGYVVYYMDRANPNAFVASVRTSGLSATITGLTSRHNYAIAVASVNAAGAGSPAGGPEINVPQ